MNEPTYLAPAHGGKRCSDREADLTNRLDFERKVSEGLLATIRRLETELSNSEKKTMSKAFCNPGSSDWREDVQASDYYNE